ncbi:MAG: cytochrome c oxidase subunit 3 family protein [Pseudomonadales bacterium]|nr:cytochrome c oxidase subunit 3 family protein [Pseudomonadales bacterium]
MDSTSTKQSLPGDFAIWIFILAELGVFGLLFITYTIVRLNNLEMFTEGHSHLNRLAGFINTIALITSSYFVVLAVNAIKKNNHLACTRWLVAAILAGSIYVFVKLWEYSETITAGYDLSTNAFYMFYYLLTFFHFAHVLLGMVILATVACNAYLRRYSAEEHYGVETGASYWHMVDLVWIVLFPLVYVIH